MNEIFFRLLRFVLLFVATLVALIGLANGYASGQSLRGATLVVGVALSIPAALFAAIATLGNKPTNRHSAWLIALIGSWPTLHVLFAWVADGHVSLDGGSVWPYILSGWLWSAAWIATRRDSMFFTDSGSAGGA